MADTDYIGIDKLKHFGVCLGLAIIHPCLAIGAAVTKEWCDSKVSGNHFCWWDLTADLVGAALGYGIHILVMRWIS